MLRPSVVKTWPPVSAIRSGTRVLDSADKRRSFALSLKKVHRLRSALHGRTESAHSRRRAARRRGRGAQASSSRGDQTSPCGATPSGADARASRLASKHARTARAVANRGNLSTSQRGRGPSRRAGLIQVCAQRVCAPAKRPNPRPALQRICSRSARPSLRAH